MSYVQFVERNFLSTLLCWIAFSGRLKTNILCTNLQVNSLICTNKNIYKKNNKIPVQISQTEQFYELILERTKVLFRRKQKPTKQIKTTNWKYKERYRYLALVMLNCIMTFKQNFLYKFTSGFENVGFSVLIIEF